jgi:hypothetical protein
MRKSINSIQFNSNQKQNSFRKSKFNKDKKNINKKRLDLTGKKQMNDEIVKNSNKKT